MILGIDASNIRTGGGLTHLKSILLSIEEQDLKFEKVIVWSNNQTLNQLPEKSWLQKSTHPYLNKSNIWSFIFQILILNKIAKQEKCSIIFAPGSTFLSPFKPFVTLSQNMLPFEYQEAKHYNFKMRIRLAILFVTQSITFKRADGMIFLTDYAKNFISKKINLNHQNCIKIPHGVNHSFSQEPKVQKQSISFSNEDPFQLLYVSYITIYKHQWNVAEAVCQLYQEGYPIKLTLVGSVLDSYEKVEKILKKHSNSEDCINYLGEIKHDQLANYYKNTDAFVYASSCENMPIILIEAMSAGLPIACSKNGPMPEVLQEAGIYFNPRNITEIKNAIKKLFEDEQNREKIAYQAYQKTLDNSWHHCAQYTFQFLYKVALETRKL